MVPDEEALDSEIISLGGSSSTSTDSYSYLLQDIENPANSINEEWEAIERTLYQEPGPQVTNPALLKECKLWRDSFTHLRVRGTKVQESGKTSNNSDPKYGHVHVHYSSSLAKLNKEREKIKKQVVGQIVQGLITKFAMINENQSDTLQLILKPKASSQSETQKLDKVYNVDHNSQKVARKEHRESYFERGKFENFSLNKRTLGGRTQPGGNHKIDNTDDNYSNSSDLSRNLDAKPKSSSRSELLGISHKNVYNRDIKSVNGEQSSVLRNQHILEKNNLTLRGSETSKQNRLKIDRLTDNLSSLNQPFEMTKRIDKKYETMLENILQSTGHHRLLATETKPKEPLTNSHKNYSESLKNLRKGSNYDEFMKRHKQLPKINKFNNNWITRAENYLNDYYSQNAEENSNKKWERSIGCENSDKSNNWISQTENVMDDNYCLFMENLKMPSKPNYSLKNNTEDIKLQRPKLFTKTNEVGKKTQKSSSCGDLSRSKASSANRFLKSSVEKVKVDGSVKKTGKTSRTPNNKMNRLDSNKSLQLPPIETGIICTELTGRLRVSSKTVPRKR